MFYKKIVREALKKSLTPESNMGLIHNTKTNGVDSLVSLLIHDLFGGEILKTHINKNWHFYNRIDGERVDFTRPEATKPTGKNRFEDIPSTPDETYMYFEQEDYSPVLIRFVRTFEEAIGLKKYAVGLAS